VLLSRIMDAVRISGLTRFDAFVSNTGMARLRSVQRSRCSIGMLYASH
jgi:hypothetical protein